MFYERFSEHNEEYLNEESISSIEQQRVRYETILKDKEISEQKERVKIEKQKQELQKILIIALIVIVILVTILAINRIRAFIKSKKHEQHLKKLNEFIKKQKETILHINKRYIEIAVDSFRLEYLDEVLPEKRISEGISRIDSLKEFLDFIYIQGDEITTDYSHFLVELCRNKERIFKTAINLTTDSPLILPTYESAQLTIIIDELIMNALKHASKNEHQFVISLSAKKSGETLEIVVKDNGIGLPDNFSINSQSRGLRVVYRFVVESLNGTIETHNDNGAVFVIKVKIEHYDSSTTS